MPCQKPTQGRRHQRGPAARVPQGWHHGSVTEQRLTSRRVCIIGDELAAGFGDPRALGWVGRVIARSGAASLLVTSLAVPGETTTMLGSRWESEVSRRLVGAGEDEAYLVIVLGTHDLIAGTSLARSRLNLANLLDRAASMRLATFVVGPPPRNDLDGTAQQELSAAFADVCQRRRVPYVETYQPLALHAQWQGDLAAGDGVHPGQAGHGLLAWLVLHHGWHEWLGVPGDPDA